MKCLEVLATRFVQEASEGQVTRTEIQNVMEWMLCNWDPTHRLELVTKSIRLGRLVVDVKFIVVPWYAQTPKAIFAMYACCNYGKQCEELL